MKSKNTILVLVILTAVLLLIAGYLLWNNKRNVKEEVKTGLPTSVEKYYQEASPAPVSSGKIETTTDLDNLSKEIDNTTVDIDSGLKQLDSDFSNF